MAGLIIFDCDGTLVDSQHLIVAAMRRAFDGAGLPPPPAEQVRRVVGLSLDEAIQRLTPDSPLDAILDLSERYKRAFGAVRDELGSHEPLFPGIAPALHRLDADGHALGVATGKSRAGLDRVLAAHGLDRLFVTLQTADGNPGKPHPAMIDKAMREAGAAPDATVMIGDTSYDMQMAKAAGVLAVGVAWGYHEVDELRAAGAARVISDIAELFELLRQLPGGWTARP